MWYRFELTKASTSTQSEQEILQYEYTIFLISFCVFLSFLLFVMLFLTFRNAIDSYPISLLVPFLSPWLTLTFLFLFHVNFFLSLCSIMESAFVKDKKCCLKSRITKSFRSCKILLRLILYSIVRILSESCHYNWPTQRLD